MSLDHDFLEVWLKSNTGKPFSEKSEPLFMASLRLAQGTAVQCYWSALATTPASISARAGAKDAINFIEFFLFAFFVCLFLQP